MSQRFSGTPANASPGPPQQRYPSPSVPSLRQYAGPTFPEKRITKQLPVKHCIKFTLVSGDNVLSCYPRTWEGCISFLGDNSDRSTHLDVLAMQMTRVHCKQRPGFTPPTQMGTAAGPNMMPRGPQQQAPYTPMRQGPITPQTGSKRPSDSRAPPPQPKRLVPIEALKRPMKQKRKLRIFISNTFYPAKEPAEGEEGSVASWELRVEGRLLEDSKNDPNKASGSHSDSSLINQRLVKRKFSSFFKSLVIELDKDLYGPDNHLVEWHRTSTTQETDGFQVNTQTRTHVSLCPQVKRPGDKNVRCTILLLLDYQPLQFKLDPRLARLLGVHTQTRPVIISALWQYIKTHKLQVVKLPAEGQVKTAEVKLFQDSHEREFINCDKYLEQIFTCPRMKFAEIPQRLNPLLHPPDPIVINHIISVEGAEQKQTACYDIDVEVDDTLKTQMNNFLLSTASQQEIQTMTDVVGNPEEERRADFFYQPWAQEAVCRYFYTKVQQKRAELEQALGIRNN
uniref:DM2 domain-containing protein n=1 Tax=Timema cristinae TaxID=61476 RepID=A0A7R9H0V0_TIMCR|nr:unnamed protein product [Timema cristinae]